MLVIEELDSCYQGLEASSVVSHIRFHTDLQIWMSMVLLTMLTRGLEKRKKYCVEHRRYTRLTLCCWPSSSQDSQRPYFYSHTISLLSKSPFCSQMRLFLSLVSWDSKGTTVQNLMLALYQVMPLLLCFGEAHQNLQVSIDGNLWPALISFLFEAFKWN